MKYFISLLSLLLLIASPSLVLAANSKDKPIKVIGRRAITVTTAKFSLGDLAEIYSPRISDDEFVIELQKIPLGESPLPGESKNISATDVLSALSERDIDLDLVGYALPRVMVVTRASRALRLEEVQAAVEKALKGAGRDATVYDIDLNQDIQVAPGLAEISAAPIELSSAGRTNFDFSVKVPGAPEVRFKVPVQLDEFREVPVAGKPLIKGSVIKATDLVKARLNIAALPRDAAFDETSILGLETSRNIGYGEVFRKAMLKIPPMISSGSRVTLQYKSKLLEASASGLALEEGIEGQVIKVRNDASKRVVSGTVIAPGMVKIQ